MAEPLEIRILNLVTKLLAHALRIWCSGKTAGAVAPCAGKSLADFLDNLRIWIQYNFHFHL